MCLRRSSRRSVEYTARRPRAVEECATTPAAPARAAPARATAGGESAICALVGTAGSKTRWACWPSTSMTSPACAGAAATAVSTAAASAVRFTYPITSPNVPGRAELRCLHYSAARAPRPVRTPLRRSGAGFLRRRERQPGRPGAARQGVQLVDPEREPEARRDDPGEGQPGPREAAPDLGDRPIPDQREQDPVRRHRAEGRQRRRRPDDQDRLPVHRRPRIREVPGRLLRAARRAGGEGQPLDRAEQVEEE